jgi:hypothetical protein
MFNLNGITWKFLDALGARSGFVVLSYNSTGGQLLEAYNFNELDDDLCMLAIRFFIFIFTFERNNSDCILRKI